MITKNRHTITQWIEPIGRNGRRQEKPWVVTHMHGSVVEHHRFATREEQREFARKLRSAF